MNAPLPRQVNNRHGNETQSIRYLAVSCTVTVDVAQVKVTCFFVTELVFDPKEITNSIFVLTRLEVDYSCFVHVTGQICSLVAREIASVTKDLYLR